MITVVDGIMPTVVRITVTTARKEEMMTGDVIINLHSLTEVVLTGHKLSRNHNSQTGHKAVVLTDRKANPNHNRNKVDVREEAVASILQAINLLMVLPV